MMVKPLLQSILVFCLFHGLVQADGIRQGAGLPPLSIDKEGELVISNDEVQYKPWSTTEFEDKVVYLQYMAARPSADKMNRHVNDALDAAGFPEGSMMSTILVNLDDVTFGASSWALRELRKNKLKHPRAHIVADSDGKGLETWQLQAKGSAVGVISKEGKVLFFKEGQLSEEEVDHVLSLLKQQIEG